MYVLNLGSMSFVCLESYKDLAETPGGGALAPAHPKGLALAESLLAEAAPFLSERTEWHVRLATDPLATSDPSRREIPSAGYNVEAVGDG